MVLSRLAADAARRHVERFNEAVRTGDWASFASRFTRDATMLFTNLPIGPFVGRDAIMRAYAQQPPDDTMTVVSVEEAGADAVRIAFTWNSGGAGAMTLRWRDGLVCDLEITFA